MILFQLIIDKKIWGNKRDLPRIPNYFKKYLDHLRELRTLMREWVLLKIKIINSQYHKFVDIWLHLREKNTFL